VSQDPTGAVIGKDDIRAQVAQVYINLKNALEAANSDVAHIIKTTVFVTSPEYRSAIVDAREDVFGPLGHYPASTYLVVSRLGNPDWLVEIEAIAALK
jgi:enamine deaminase RidA (YjgF/YER057c/UK114 family)